MKTAIIEARAMGCNIGGPENKLQAQLAKNVVASSVSMVGPQFIIDRMNYWAKDHRQKATLTMCDSNSSSSACFSDA